MTLCVMSFLVDNDANIDILPIDYETDEFMPRSSKDKIINANGRKLLDLCKLNALRIANGRPGSDRGVGKYTYVGSTGRSVIDYVIATPNLLNTISTFHVGEPNILSDHCLIDFSMISRNRIQLFHGCLVNSQNYSSEVLRTARCTIARGRRPRAIVHRDVRSTKGLWF